ncbi:MAG: threalose-6-phosphate phosphatase, partial [Lichina confinis]
MTSLPATVAVDAHVGTPRLDADVLRSRYRSSQKRLLMFDYDGTLTPIVDNPAAAVPSETVKRTLQRLASDPCNTVWIISGRDQDFLEQYLGSIPELGFSAEHGSFIREPTSTRWTNLAEDSDMGWQNEVVDVFEDYTRRTQGSFIERKRIAVTWHYRGADPEVGAMHAQECRRALEAQVVGRWDIDIMSGKANLEVRPSFVNKGEITKKLVLRDQESPPDFVMCMGDDFTDE